MEAMPAWAVEGARLRNEKNERSIQNTVLDDLRGMDGTREVGLAILAAGCQ